MGAFESFLLVSKSLWIVGDWGRASLCMKERALILVVCVWLCGMCANMIAAPKQKPQKMSIGNFLADDCEWFV